MRHQSQGVSHMKINLKPIDKNLAVEELLALESDDCAFTSSDATEELVRRGIDYPRVRGTLIPRSEASIAW
jgi:hypothetical protein